MSTRIVAPHFRATTFTCPHCGALAQQDWGTLDLAVHDSDALAFAVALCLACRRPTLWDGTGTEYIGDPPAGLQHQVWRLVYPSDTSQASEPNEDLPDDVRADYIEAAAIAARSPRGAAALLRLCVQRLCVHFGEPGKHIDTDIRSLVAKGKLTPSIQRAMDTVRITGNESVHPGELNVQDDPDLVAALFLFVNLIAQQAISEPKLIEAMYERMPEAKREAVDLRDTPPPE